MADRRRTALLHRARSVSSADSLTAATKALDTYDEMSLTINPTEPQREAWNYYHALGEVNYAIGSWLSNAISRCRLIAATRSTSSDDPTPVVDGPVAEIVGMLGGGPGGQSTILKRMTVQVSVPGESFLVMEEVDGIQSTYAYSNTELRITGRGPLSYQINDQRNHWRSLAPNSLVSRVWWPDDEINWAPSSPVLGALPIMREIDMYNRYIMAVLLSRVVNNGILLVPSEVTLPSLPQFKDAADPFMAQFIDAGQRAIKNPGTAGAAFPFPLKVPAQFIESFKHLTFATEMGDKVLDDRDKALNRLANALNMPSEVLTGMGAVNHWGQWQLEESAVKIHIAPVIEVIVEGLTQTYLRPMLKAAGSPLVDPSGDPYIIWYDYSALIQQPDRSAEAFNLYDHGLLSTEALVRETGFDTDDMPKETKTMSLEEQVLLKIALTGGADSMAALSLLTGNEDIATTPQRVTVTDPNATPTDQTGTPPQEDQGPPTKGPNPTPTPAPARPSPQGPSTTPPAR
jgi:hypothetical protein